MVSEAQHVLIAALLVVVHHCTIRIIRVDWSFEVYVYWLAKADARLHSGLDTLYLFPVLCICPATALFHELSLTNHLHNHQGFVVF